MHSKFLVSFFLCMCALNKFSKSSVIDHVGTFETGENLENETQVLETTTLASVTLKDASNAPESTGAPNGPGNTEVLKLTESDVPIVPENTEVPKMQENREVPNVFYDTEIPNVPETTYVPNVPETTYVPNVPKTTYVPNVPETTYVPYVPETTDVPNVPDSRISTEIPTIGMPGATSKTTPHETTIGTVTRPSPPQRFVPKHRIEERTPKKHVYSLFEMCPPLGENCPACSVPQNHLSQYMCYYPVALKVLLLSPPETDSSGRMCGKLGKLLVHGTIDSKQFRSLLRFSIGDNCGCNLKVSQHYFLFTQMSEFTKQGRVYSKISLSDQSLLVPVDPYTEPEILHELRTCSPEQIGIIPNEQVPQQTLNVESKHEPLYTQRDLQSISHDPSHQEILYPDSTLQVSPRSARNSYQTNPSGSYISPHTNPYFPPLTPSQVQYPVAPMNFPKFPTMPSFNPKFSQNQPQPSIYVPPIFHQAHPEVHKSVAYSSSNQGHQVSVQTDVRYDSKSGSIKVGHSGMVPSSGSEYSERPPLSLPQGNKHMDHSSGTIQVLYEPPEYEPKSSVPASFQNAHVMKSSFYPNPGQQINSSSSFSFSSSSTISGQPQQQYISTNCLNSPFPSTCPYCARYDANKFPAVYCNSTYAFLSAITFPGRSSRRSGTEYECLIVQSQLLHDISKDVGRHNLFQSLSLLLPAHCDCLSNQIDPAVILFLGNTDPQPRAPLSQLTKDHILILLPAPSDTTLPICKPYKTREEVKSAISYQPPVEYESVVNPSTPSPPVIQYPVAEQSMGPEVIEYTSDIQYPSSTEGNLTPVTEYRPNSAVQTPDYKSADYQEPVPSQTTYGASEPNYEEVNSVAPESLQNIPESVKYPANYEAIRTPVQILSNPIPGTSPKVIENSFQNQQSAYEEGYNLPPIQPPTYEASKPVLYPVSPPQVNMTKTPQTFAQQPYETPDYPAQPQMQDYEAVKSSAPQTYIQEYESGTCPTNVVHSCPLSNGKYDDSHAPHYCAAPFAIIVDLLGPGFQRPYYTFPRISVNTTSSSVQEEKIVVVSVSDPPPLSCSQRSVKVIKNIGTQPENFQEGNQIPIVLVSNCHFEYAGRNKINRLLLHSSTIPNYLHNGGIQVTEQINVVSLDPLQPLPMCIVSRPMNVSPPVYQNPPPYYPSRKPHYTQSPAPPTNQRVSPQNRPINEIPHYTPPLPESKLTYIPPSFPVRPLQYPSYPENKPPAADARPAHTQFPSPPESKLTYIPPSFPTRPPQYNSQPENKPMYRQPPTQTRPLLPTQNPSYPENKPIYIPLHFETRLPNTIYDKPYASPIGLNKPLDYTPPILRPQFPIPSLQPYKIHKHPSGVPPNPQTYPVPTCPELQQPLSCPTYTEIIPFNFHDMYCKSKFAMIVAIGVDKDAKHIIQREGPRVLPFLKPKKSKLEFKMDPPPHSFNLTVTLGKTAERRQNNANYFSYKATAICNNEVVAGLYDVSPQKTAIEFWVDLNLYVPISCQFSGFDNSPSYGILMSLRQPNLAGPIQLAQDFAFFPLPEGKLELPTCSLPPRISPAYPPAPYYVVKYVPPALHGHKMEVKCTNDTCGTCDFVRPANALNIPCDMRFVAVVEILETSADVNVAPTLDIQHYFSYEEHVQGVVLNVKSNVDEQSYVKSPEDTYSSMPSSGNVKCRYAKVRVVKDLSPYSTYPTKDKEITLIIPWNCKCHLFDVYSGYAVLMTKFSILSNFVVPITRDLSKISCLPIGSIKIEACPAMAHVNWIIYNSPNEQNPAHHEMSYSFSYSQNPELYSHVPSEHNPYPPNNAAQYTSLPASFSSTTASYVPEPHQLQNTPAPHLSAPVSHNLHPDQYLPVTPSHVQLPSPEPYVISDIKDSYVPAQTPELYASQITTGSYSPPPVPASYAPQPAPRPHISPVVKYSYVPAPSPGSYATKPVLGPYLQPAATKPVLGPYLQPATKDSYSLESSSEPYAPPALKDLYAPTPVPNPYVPPPSTKDSYPPEAYVPQPSHGPYVQPAAENSYAPVSAPMPYTPPHAKDSYAPAPAPELYPQPANKNSYVPEQAPQPYPQQPSPEPYFPPSTKDSYVLQPLVPDTVYSHATVYEPPTNPVSYGSQVKNFSIGSINVNSAPEQPLMCSDHSKATLVDCPVCEEIRCMKPEVYCNSKFTVVARPIGVYKDESSQAAGNIITLYDITSHKPAQRAVSNIIYKLPKQCSCSILEENRFIVLLIEDEMTLSTPFVVDLNAGDYVYSTFSGKMALPSCTSDRPRSGNGPEEIVLPPVQDSDMPDFSKPSACPNHDYSCPKCHGSVGDDELKNLVCSSDNAILISLDGASINGSSSWWKKEQVTVTQYIGQNYSIGIEIYPRKFESRCNLLEEAGDCDSIITRFHYDVNDEVCYAFEYSGCNGNANNFKTEEECDEICIKNYNCTSGNLRLHKVMQGISKVHNETFQFALPEHCNCPQLSTGEIGYLLFNTSSSEVNFPAQFNQNYKLLRLSEVQLNMEIICEGDIAETKSVEHYVENSTGTVENDIDSTTISTTTKKPKPWLFG